jgi:hypothetical protein
MSREFRMECSSIILFNFYGTKEFQKGINMEWARRFLLEGPDLTNVVASVLLAAVVGLIISQLYRYTHRGLNYEHTFMAALVMLGPIIAVVMLYIRGDLVLSLGLIGSLSIIRFRTAIKDTRDMVFLFWIIAVGLGAGPYNWGIVVISSLIIVILVALLFFVRYGFTLNKDYVLVINGDNSLDGERTIEIVHGYSQDPRLRSFNSLETGREMIIELELSDPHPKTAEHLINDIEKLPGVKNVSLLAPQLALPI